MKKSAAIAALSALAQESRLDIYRLLVQAGPAGKPAGQIGEKLGLPSATLSFHLNQLRQAGLVTFRREGRSLIYAAQYDTMNGVLTYLTENCCQGDLSVCHAAGCSPEAAPASITSGEKSNDRKHRPHDRRCGAREVRRSRPARTQ